MAAGPLSSRVAEPMRVAFHFDADRFGSQYGAPTTALLFHAIVLCIPEERRDLLIRRGDFPAWDIQGGVPAFAAALFECERDILSTITETSFASMLSERNVWVLA